MLDEEGVVRSRVQQTGLKVKCCVAATAIIAFLFVVAGVIGVAVFVNQAMGSTDAPLCGVSEAECAAEARANNVSAHERIQVVLGNGCFWERQYAYAMLEYGNSLFARELPDLTSRAGYAGALDVGSDGRVCYHHSGGDQSDIYSTLGHAEGVSVLLDNDGETSHDGGRASVLAQAQFTLLAQDFLDSFTYSASKGGNSRPDPGDTGAEYRSFLVRCVCVCGVCVCARAFASAS